MLKKCCDCGEEVKQKKAKKVKKEWYCPSCYKELRKKHRENTIKEAGIEKELEELIIKRRAEYEKRYKEKKAKQNPKPIVLEKEIVKHNYRKPRKKDSSFISFEERKVLLSHLIKNGLEFEEAIERIKELSESLKELRRNRKSEDIKTKQERMIQELYNSVITK